MATQEREKVRRKLDDLATWTPEELDEEFSEWTPEEIAKFWSLLETPYRQICRAFGLASQRQRVSIQGIKTHKQINRLAVLQSHAQRAVKA